jgi:hypothetical protein
MEKIEAMFAVAEIRVHVTVGSGDNAHVDPAQEDQADDDFDSEIESHLAGSVRFKMKVETLTGRETMKHTKITKHTKKTAPTG